MNDNSWLCRLSRRWDKDLDQETLDQLKARPELEAFKVWLARVALPLVEAQAKVQSRRQRVDPNGQVIDASTVFKEEEEYRVTAGRLEIIAAILLELETTQEDRRRYATRRVDTE